ncbi:MAG: hypothetical protein SGI99_01970 [Pseudomonadota bacterium]|nr:hypothetical protein [Pseudomonadota bacterium]
MPTIIRLVLLALLATSSHASQAAQYRVGGNGGACQFPTIQAAINAAALNPGSDDILIARNATYSAQALTISGQTVRLMGGYANCVQVTADTTRTILSGAGGSAVSVITVLAEATVALQALTITGGDEATSVNGFGGGIDISGNAFVSLNNVDVSSNAAGFGGGISVTASAGTFNPSQLAIIEDVVIRDNAGNHAGGGIYCANSWINMFWANSTIYQNRAGSATSLDKPGGGIRAQNCKINIATSSLVGTISGNTATGAGGGVSITGSDATMSLYNKNPNTPLSIIGNTANGVGGALDIRDSAQVYGFDIVIADNISRTGGGAVSLYDSDGNRRTKFVMQGTLNGSPAGAVNCSASFDCNRINGNIARTVAGAQLPAAAIRFSGETDNGSNGIAEFELYGTRLTGNIGESLSYAVGASWGRFDGTLIDNNTVSIHLLDIGAAGSFAVTNSTISNNSLPNGAVIRGFATELRRSLIWQPGRDLFSHPGGGNNGAGTVTYTVSNNLHGVTPDASNVIIANPMFVNAGGGDFHLAAGAPAIDYATPSGAHSRDRFARNIDLTLEPNPVGLTQDAGAYEKQSDDGYNAAPVITLPAASLTTAEDSFVFISGYALNDPNGDVDGRLVMGVARASGGFQSFWFGDTSYVESSTDPADTFFPNNVAITGPMASITNHPINGTGGSFFYPKPNVNGPISISLQLHDLGNTGFGGNLIDSEVMVIDVIPVNDKPAFKANVPILRAAGTSGLQIVNLGAHINDLVFGPADESAQTIAAWEFVALVDDEFGVLAATPSLTGDGFLAFQLSGVGDEDCQCGSAFFSARIRDNGGTANGGIDTSNAEVFEIRVTANGLFANGFE